MNLRELKQTVKEAVAEIAGVPAYFDTVPLGVRNGAFVTLERVEVTDRDLPGAAQKRHATFEVFLFSFDSREKSDEAADKTIAGFDGMYSEDFSLISVTAVTPLDFSYQAGFFATAVTLRFDLCRNLSR